MLLVGKCRSVSCIISQFAKHVLAKFKTLEFLNRDSCYDENDNCLPVIWLWTAACWKMVKTSQAMGCME